MNLRLVPIAIILTFAAVLAACERPPTAPNPAELEAQRRRDEQIQALEEKIAQLQDLERQAAERKLGELEEKASANEKRASVTEQERQRLEKEKQALLRERERLSDAREKAEKDAANAERNAAETARRAKAERQERTMDLFYTALDPHGEWMELDQYGYVWRPNTASNPRWRPYTDGRWVFTDYGWTWKSNEPFGWAAYHYGRWARIKRLGWVWVPGTEWGPAWVSWRRGDRFVGWAPLPPEAWSGSGFNGAVDSYYEIGPSSYTFVPVEQIGEQSYVNRVVEPERNVTIVNQTVNVTNIKYTNVQNTTVVYNGGPELADVNARSQQKVPRLNVERVTDLQDARDLGRAEQKGNTLVIAAPRIAPKKESEKPVRVKEQMKSAEVERGWTDIDKTAAEQARVRFTKEARQAEDRQRNPGSARENAVSPGQQPTTTSAQAPNKSTPAAKPQTAPTAGTARTAEGAEGSPAKRAPRAEDTSRNPVGEKATPAGDERAGANTAATPAPATPSAAIPPSPAKPRDRVPKASPAPPKDVPVNPLSTTPQPATPAKREQNSTRPDRQRPLQEGGATSSPATPAASGQESTRAAGGATPGQEPTRNGLRPDRKRRGEESTPASALDQNGRENSTQQHRPRGQRGEGTTKPSLEPATPPSASPSARPEGANTTTATAESEAAPERRLPKARRPRPGTAATPPPGAPTPASPSDSSKSSAPTPSGKN